MNIDRAIKIGIISSVVATFLFIYLLDPLLRSVTFVLFNVLGSAARWYTDRLFAQAALLVGPDPSLYVLLFIVIIGNGAIILAFLGSVTWTSRDGEVPFLRWAMKIPTRALRGVVGVSMVVSLVSSVLLIYSSMFGLRITSSFNQHLAAVAPFIGDQEVKLLRSRWTQMTNERDYLSIYTDLTAIAIENHIKLPENKIFSVSSL